MSTPVVIEAALNGVTSKHRNPNAPIAPDEQARDGLACVDAGSTVIHTHCANIAAPPEDAAVQYAAEFEPFVAAHPGIVCYPTTGIGATIDDRYRHIELLDDMGLVRAGFVDTGSVNLGGTGPDGLPVEPGYVYTNSFSDIAHKMRVCSQRNLGPSVAIFEPGFLRVVLAYHDAGKLPEGTLVKFYFSGGGYLGGGAPLWGAPPTIESLDMYLAMLGDAPIPWAVAVLGGSVCDTPVARATLERGGHLRVGIEDWDDGPANVEQVRAAAALCGEVGRPLASAKTIGEVLNLPKEAAPRA